MKQLRIRSVKTSDAQGIVDIYNLYVTTTTVSFEEVPVTVDEIHRRIEMVQLQQLPWLCVDYGNELAGYAYASRWRERSAYRFTAETTIYLAQVFTGRGIGKVLYSELLEQVRSAGMHAVMAVITLPNPASVALHEELGFEKVAHFTEVGFKFNKWIDVGYWQLIIRN